MFPNDDQEMNRIYQESLHPKDYSQDGAYSNMGRKQNASNNNAFKQDVHANVNRYSSKKTTSSAYHGDSTKAVIQALIIIGMVILTLIFILVPMILSK